MLAFNVYEPGSGNVCDTKYWPLVDVVPSPQSHEMGPFVPCPPNAAPDHRASNVKVRFALSRASGKFCTPAAVDIGTSSYWLPWCAGTGVNPSSAALTACACTFTSPRNADEL